MELHSAHKTFHHSHLGEEKHQMLNLNRRLETYLSRVKLLEEENALLAKEIQALRRSGHGALTRRKGLEEELRQARLEVDAAWRDRAHTELEVGRLAEELQVLDQQRQREAEAQVKAKTKLEQSRKELAEEQRAQIWLREKVGQLEHEMRHLIQTHQEDAAHLEATLAHSRATVPPTLAQRSNQTPNLLQLGDEYSQRASRAWQEAAEAYQGQLARLEESLDQARSRLSQVGQEKSESQLKLRALEKEITSAQDVRLHLEKMVAQQGHEYSQEIQQLQEHLEGLEGEKTELGRRIDQLLLENRGLVQVKMSLGLEVATYRALLDGESLRGDVSSLNQPRNISIRDAVFSSHGVKTNYQTQLSAFHKTTSPSPVRGVTGTQSAAVTAVTPAWSKKPTTFTETPKTSKKPACEDTTKLATLETPYPKILQDGAVENFRPQEVHETVTYAEPLSPPNEQEALAETSQDKAGEEDWSKVSVEPPVESAVSHQVVSGLGTEPRFTDVVNQQEFTTSSLAPYTVRVTEEPFGFSDDHDKDVPFEIPADEEDIKEPHVPVDAWLQKECKEQEEASDSETEAVLEPNFESRTSSPVSEYEPEDNMFNRVREFSQDDNISKEDAVEQQQEISCTVVETKETDVEDKLYPDGEEMDTWDSVIERKVDLKTDERDPENQQHAEPEEDISTKEQEGRQVFALNVQRDESVASPLMDVQVDGEGQCAAIDQEHAPLPDDKDNDEEEDSQNVSVSWRTEVESDSYAQDNTLADTRPLIRYKSDETDANTQASHMDESESSEGEQEKKIGETGTETWSDGKSKRFGTMEDLCEEVEEEVLDGEYDLGYTHVDDRDHGVAVSEHATLATEGHSDEETEELTKPMVPANVDYDEELDTDRLVEEELENLATDSYSAHFAQQQAREEMLDLLHEPVENPTEQEEAGETKTDDTSPTEECEVRVNQQLLASSAITDEPHENQYFSDSSSVVSQIDTLAEEGVEHKDQEAPEERQEEVEHDVSMVTHDVTEDHSGFSGFISRPEMEETNNSEEPNSVLQANLHDVAVPTEVEEVVPEEPSTVSQEHLIEGVSDPEAPETTEWEVLENPSEDSETRDQIDDEEEEEEEDSHDVPESAERYLDNDGGSNEGVMTEKEEALEMSPDSVPDENDIFVVKASSDLLETSGKDNSLHDFFSSGVKNDFWVSSLETGATFQPDDASNEAAEQTNQSRGFAGSPVWGDLANPNMVLDGYADIDSSKALTANNEQEQMHLEVKSVLRRGVVEGGSAHSEDSEAEVESWSSGEERV